jgi:putative ABC transport system ATP-binding protein
MNSPTLILADEPTGSLDSNSGRAVLDLLFDEADLSGATVVVVTHDSTILDGFDRVVDLVGEAS